MGVVLFPSMMSNETCAKCGAELLAGARFCRRCGEPSRPFDRSSMTEAETRVFQATEDRSAKTQYHDPRPTGPSYLAPNETATSPASASSDPEHSRLKRHGILWASAILVVVLLLFGVVMALKWNRTSSSPTPTTRIDVPPSTGIVPPVPSVPPEPATTGKRSASELDYPGADVTMEMTRGEEGGIRQLRTSDSFDKVVAWYKEKLKPINTTIVDGKAILPGRGTTAIIKSEGGETTILLTQGVDQSP